MEKELKITAKLYEYRDTMKSFLKDSYKERLQPYTLLIKKVMKANKVEEIGALLLISETEIYQENPMSQIMFMSAVVEMIEPTV